MPKIHDYSKATLCLWRTRRDKAHEEAVCARQEVLRRAGFLGLCKLVEEFVVGERHLQLHGQKATDQEATNKGGKVQKVVKHFLLRPDMGPGAIEGFSPNGETDLDRSLLLT